jgi:hypothetical protein
MPEINVLMYLLSSPVVWSLDCYGWNQTRAEAREQSVTKVWRKCVKGSRSCDGVVTPQCYHREWKQTNDGELLVNVQRVNVGGKQCQ